MKKTLIEIVFSKGIWRKKSNNRKVNPQPLDMPFIVDELVPIHYSGRIQFRALKEIYPEGANAYSIGGNRTIPHNSAQNLRFTSVQFYRI